jgi:DNA-binding NtrC family response regulator
MERLIVIIDDTFYMAALVRRYLEFVGYRNVLTFSNPTLALELIAKNISRINLVITDYDMPQMTGLEVISAVKECNPAIPTILLTEDSREPLMAIAPDCPVLNKRLPMFISELASTVSEALNAAETSCNASLFAGAK